MPESLQIIVFWISRKAWIANLNQMKPSIETEAVSKDLSSSRTGRKAALDNDIAVVILATIRAVGDISTI